MLCCGNETFVKISRESFRENFGKIVCNFLAKLSRESFVENYHPGRVKFLRNFTKTYDSYHIGLIPPLK